MDHTSITEARTNASALLALAAKIGMHRNWFQDKSIPHYDLSPKRREAAIEAGAVEVDRRTAVTIWRHRRARLRGFH